MTDKQWESLKAVIRGEEQEKPLAGFIIDSPWLPGWYGIPILDYFTSDELWLKANIKAMNTFPDLIFLPGFWSEYGMCTEPSAFGAKSIFWKNEFPFANPIIKDTADIDALTVPNPETDGLLPFMLNRLVRLRPDIENQGHKIKFSVSRGPLNIASFLMGTTEFLTTMMMDPEAAHRLLRKITDFILSWHKLQREAIPTIEGTMLLDDIVGFLGEDDFKEFAMPYMKEIYAAGGEVRFFHNDADCTSSVKYYSEIGINLYNPGVHMTLSAIREVTGDKLPILGNIPPRDILAAGTPADVTAAVEALKAEAEGFHKMIFSCGGGMPPGVSTENIHAFIEAIQ